MIGIAHDNNFREIYKIREFVLLAKIATSRILPDLQYSSWLSQNECNITLGKYDKFILHSIAVFCSICL